MTNPPSNSSAGRLHARIADRSARIGVIGMGYVGLPLAVALAERGYPVVGIDVDADKVAGITRGSSPIGDIEDDRLAKLVDSEQITATTEYDAAASCDVLFVCVPTPFDRHKTPDLRFVKAAADGIGEHLHAGQLIILQSTTYPGTTTEVVLPRLERSGLRAGEDFFLAFSPERIDPGVPKHTVENTPKVVGGVTESCADLAAELLATMGAGVHRVSSPRVAEMTKLLENIFRSVNIALVNELALLSERMGVDMWEVIDAAATKPFGFMPFWPGAGVGGHCIPIDPYYLSWKAREYDVPMRFIELAAEVNGWMPHHVADLVDIALDRHGKPVRDAQVLVLGVAFKPDVDDARHSPADRVMALLVARGARLRFHDPHVERFTFGGDAFLSELETLHSQPLTRESLAEADVVVIVARHASVDYDFVCQHAALVVDTANATKGVDFEPDAVDVVRLGAGHRAPIMPQRTSTGVGTTHRGAAPAGASGA